jgi:hypothetical protein
MGMKQMLLHLLEDLIILIIIQVFLILISKLIFFAISTDDGGTNYFADIIELKLVLRQD